MSTSSTPYDWVREVKPELKQLDAIPLTGTAPPFPWEEFSSRLARTFDHEGLRIEPQEMTWRAKESLYEGLGDAPLPLIVSVPPLKGQVCWVVPSQEIEALAALLLTQDAHPLHRHDAALTESFYRFLALEALHHLTQVGFDPTLNPILTNQTTLPHQDSLCWDISLHLQAHTIWGRLIISPEFRHAWVEHFAQKQEASPLSQQMAQLAEILVHVELGKTYLSLAEWRNVQAGDFILLDEYSVNADKLEGRVTLTANGQLTFRAKLKEGTLKILELPLLHEVQTPMVKHPEDEDEDDLSDLDLTDEPNDEFEDEDLFKDTDDDLFKEEEEADEQAFPSPVAPERPAPQRTVSQSNNEKALASSHAQQLTSPEQLPITLTIEVGQIEMTMDQLLKLEPGNLLDLNLHPENGVDLTINGKIVAKGELIRIGESLGVRVLQIGR